MFKFCFQMYHIIVLLIINRRIIRMLRFYQPEKISNWAWTGPPRWDTLYISIFLNAKINVFFLFGYRLIKDRYKLALRSAMTFSFSHFSAASYGTRNRTFKYFTGESSIHKWRLTLKFKNKFKKKLYGCITHGIRYYLWQLKKIIHI